MAVAAQLIGRFSKEIAMRVVMWVMAGEARDTLLRLLFTGRRERPDQVAKLSVCGFGQWMIDGKQRHFFGALALLMAGDAGAGRIQ